MGYFKKGASMSKHTNQDSKEITNVAPKENEDTKYEDETYDKAENLGETDFVNQDGSITRNVGSVDQ